MLSFWLNLMLMVVVGLTGLVPTLPANPLPQAACCPSDDLTWVWPLPGSHTTQRYSATHPGLDLSAPVGSTVRAVARGVVRYAGDSGGPYGRLVIVRHADHCETWYAHLNTIEVHWPQAITSGERLGQMGGTGNATGWHLHLEVRTATIQIDPWSCLMEQKSHHHGEVEE